MIDSIEGAKLDTHRGLYGIPCETNIESLEFTINGKEYTVPGEDLVVQDETGLYCFLRVAVLKLFGENEGDILDGELDETEGNEINHIAGNSGGIPGTGPIPLEFTANTWLIGDIFL